MNQGTIGRLKKVSGKLRRMWVGPDRPRKQEGEMRLLVVDGEESICFSMKEYFTLQGYQVDTARELEEAERLVENGDYEVVIQDLRLGPAQRPDGLEMIKFIRDQNPRTIIIVLTAYGSAEMEEEAFRGGADAFLRKPKPLSQVAQVIQGLIESPPKQAAHGAA
ncbi:MAG TPA: response regulator [Pyrinomonadaceae bacterium]|nr:response regulator [Pyrinomonadaceae bacterium]